MSLQVVDDPIILDETGQRIADALEARNSEMGALSGLTTDAKTSLAAAINEVDGHADENAANIASHLTKITTLESKGNWRTGLRFKNLGTSFTAAQQAALVAGDFSEFWNGDCWVINGITWRIVDNSQFQKRRGDTEFTQNHLMIMPDSNLVAPEAYLVDGGASSSNTDTHGYANCGYRTDEKTGKGRTQCKTLFQNAFGASHIASHKELMSTSRGAGGATAWGWQNADVELPSEVNIYGHSAWGCSLQESAYSPGFNIGSQWGQFKLFELAPQYAFNRVSSWLRDIVSASRFAVADGSGAAYDNTPSHSNRGLRPYAILV